MKAETCPYCKEEIKADATKCKHCHAKLSEKRPDHEGICPFCKEGINPEAIKCKHCKSNFAASTSCKCSSNEEGDIAKIQAQMASMGSINPAASSLTGRNFGLVEIPPIDCKTHCFWGPDGIVCYFFCHGPANTSFTSRLSAF